MSYTIKTHHRTRDALFEDDHYLTYEVMDGQGQVIKRFYEQSLYTRGETFESGYASVNVQHQDGRQILVLKDWSGKETHEILP